MNLYEKLIGFDARKMWLDPNIHWNKERKAHFLLRMDAKPILSTDELVWPSIFRTHQMPTTSDTQLQELRLTGPRRPAWIGPNISLWEELGKLKDHLLDKNREISRPYWIIAITCIAQPEIVSQTKYGPYFEETNPSRRDQTWTFLGYDVSDGSLLSGLTNCGYTQDDRRQQWLKLLVKELNQYHLFDSVEPANVFREQIDRRVTEHAPFLVYGLYLIEEVVA